ncbi:MAG: hypothetical protein GF346_06710 [Candidatus Eisenbacteria bacterium]|nr:hypothetical protein [Candidatus Latescibacterota bacterium]MBD3302119.1 hypothetical protein [Candidatus Eisenbacteria bacterium]
MRSNSVRNGLPVLLLAFAFLWGLGNPTVWAVCLYCEEEGDLFAGSTACCCGEPEAVSPDDGEASRLAAVLPCPGCDDAGRTTTWVGTIRATEQTTDPDSSPAWHPGLGSGSPSGGTRSAGQPDPTSPPSDPISLRSTPLIC